MTDLLIVLNPRRILECIDAIAALNIPKVWLRYMSEPQAANVANEIARDSTFDRYIVLSDDTVPSQDALDLVQRTADEGHPVVTGYCNLDEGDYAQIVNLTSNVLGPPPPFVHSYKFMERQTAEREGPLIPSTFAGLSLTCLERQVLLDHPLQTVAGTACCMDYDLSYRLAQSGIPIVAPAGAFIRHVKERWNTRDRSREKQLLVGYRPAEVVWDAVEAPA